jgi:hypothetical protein
MKSRYPHERMHLEPVVRVEPVVRPATLRDHGIGGDRRRLLCDGLRTCLGGGRHGPVSGKASAGPPSWSVATASGARPSRMPRTATWSPGGQPARTRSPCSTTASRWSSIRACRSSWTRFQARLRLSVRAVRGSRRLPGHHDPGRPPQECVGRLLASLGIRFSAGAHLVRDCRLRPRIEARDKIDPSRNAMTFDP